MLNTHGRVLIGSFTDRANDAVDVPVTPSQDLENSDNLVIIADCASQKPQLCL